MPRPATFAPKTRISTCALFPLRDMPGVKIHLKGDIMGDLPLPSHPGAELQLALRRDPRWSDVMCDGPLPGPERMANANS